MAILKDDSPMPFGKHKGDAMEDVPASYLLYLYRSPGKGHSNVDAYIRDNLQVLEKEEKEEIEFKKEENDTRRNKDSRF